MVHVLLPLWYLEHNFLCRFSYLCTVIRFRLSVVQGIDQFPPNYFSRTLGGEPSDPH